MKSALYLITITLFLFSCKKEKLDIQEGGSSVQFNSPTTPGSYWIYQHYKIDTNGVETQVQQIDSLIVLGDTLIDNLTYTVYENFRIVNNNLNQMASNVSFSRDSSGYRVDRNCEISYSFSNFTDTISKVNVMNLWQSRTKMFKEIQVSVPAGSFSAIEARRHYYSLNGGPANNCGEEYYTLSSWYVDGIGKVKETTGYVTQLQKCGERIDIRLVDYYIAP